MYFKSTAEEQHTKSIDNPNLKMTY